ncbi:MAG: hypothetical protein HYT89_00155 [Candidatus Omnitrophica bacterium]|nr:hypothetical protein [Candidatus Omnitrophota bacterium]
MDALIASFPKNETEEIRLELRQIPARRQAGGRQEVLDIRVWTTIPEAGEKVPTGRGLSLEVSRLEDLKKAVLDAERFLEERRKMPSP